MGQCTQRSCAACRLGNLKTLEAGSDLLLWEFLILTNQDVCGPKLVSDQGCVMRRLEARGAEGLKLRLARQMQVT